jgi:hypothetical protein
MGETVGASQAIEQCVRALRDGPHDSRKAAKYFVLEAVSRFLGVRFVLVMSEIVQRHCSVSRAGAARPLYHQHHGTTVCTTSSLPPRTNKNVPPSHQVIDACEAQDKSKYWPRVVHRVSRKR